MNAWKVILATLVIYVAGLLTGVFLLRVAPPAAPARPQVESPQIIALILAQQRLLDRMKQELRLTPQQLRKINAVFTDSRDHMKAVWTILEPEVQTEVAEVRDHIRAELTADQREKFEKLLKNRPRIDGPQRNPDPNRKRLRDNAAGKTGATNDASLPAKAPATNQAAAPAAPARPASTNDPAPPASQP